MNKDKALKLALDFIIATNNSSQFWLVPESNLNKTVTAIKEALTQSEPCQCPNCKVTLHASDCAVHSGPAYPAGGCDCGAQQGPEFFTHNVEQPYDWSEWVCPDPKGYLMKCCDCGLVHESQFGVVRYKSETEREDCDRVDDPNLQAVFRMRRSEQWSPADMAHRAGGLTMEQGAVAKKKHEPKIDLGKYAGTYGGYTTPEPSEGYLQKAYRLANELRSHLSIAPPQRKPLDRNKRLEIAELAAMKFEWSSDYIQAISFVVEQCEAAHGIKEKA